MLLTHSSLPWSFDLTPYENKNGEEPHGTITTPRMFGEIDVPLIVADLNCLEEIESNARIIVCAVNLHQKLIDVVEEYIERHESVRCDKKCPCRTCQQAYRLLSTAQHYLHLCIKP